MRRVVNRWDWYEWFAWTRVCIDMIGTPSLPLTLIWLRQLGPNLHRYGMVSHSYRCKLWFKPLNHISFSSYPRVSLISVSIRSFCRSHIRHPLYFRSILPGQTWSLQFCVSVRSLLGTSSQFRSHVLVLFWVPPPPQLTLHVFHWPHPDKTANLYFKKCQ